MIRLQNDWRYANFLVGGTDGVPKRAISKFTMLKEWKGTTADYFNQLQQLLLHLNFMLIEYIIIKDDKRTIIPPQNTGGEIAHEIFMLKPWFGR